MVLSAIEVRNNSPLKDTQAICDLLFNQEHYIWECFGCDFYDKLKEDLNTVEADEWADRIYKEGDVVYYQGYFYKSTIDRSRSRPTDPECWAQVDKFKSACYNEIWPLLRDWLANRIAIEAIDFLNYRYGENGIQQNIDNQTNKERASESAIRMRRQRMKEINERRFVRLLEAMEASPCEYPKIKCCKDEPYYVNRQVYSKKYDCC